MAFYRKTALQELTPWTPDIPMGLVSVSVADVAKGSPKAGDMLACNPDDVCDWRLIEEQFFKANYEWVTD
tara:strand:+ start:47 stop:256 length:210 start_codon:yes stop_codon:yes gene_type:complete